MKGLSEKQDKELVALLKEGSKQAFAELYVRYREKLTLFCIRMLRDEIRAEDIVHDVFLQILENQDSLDPEKSFCGYLQTIAQNRILDEFKRFDVHLRYAQHTMTHENEETNQTENQIIYNDYARLLNELIDALTPRQKTIFRLSRIQGLSYNEIGEQLNISLPAVKKHATLALDTIKKQLTEHADIHFKAVTVFLIFFL